MNCPKCVGILEKKTMEGIEVDSCFECEGIWFDAGELESVLKRDSQDFELLDVGREDFDGKEMASLAKELDAKAGKCPKCGNGTLLLRQAYKGKHKVNIDVCPKGHGLWLDGGEIKKLRKRGLVNMKDHVDVYMDFLHYAFSKDGFKDFMSKVRGKDKFK